MAILLAWSEDVFLAPAGLGLSELLIGTSVRPGDEAKEGRDQSCRDTRDGVRLCEQ